MSQQLGASLSMQEVWIQPLVCEVPLEEEKKAIPAEWQKVSQARRLQKRRTQGKSFNDFFLFFLNETKQIPFPKTKIRSRIKCISELSDLTEAKAIF